MGDGPGGGPSSGDLADAAAIAPAGGAAAVAAGAGAVPGVGTSGSSPATIDALIAPVPVIGPINSAMAALGAGSLGHVAQGDPNSGPAGVSGSEGGPGVGGGPSDFQTEKKVQRALRTAPVTPPPVGPTLLSKEEDLKRKRFGRPQTILTSRNALSDVPLYKPTLLGQ